MLPELPEGSDEQKWFSDQPAILCDKRIYIVNRFVTDIRAYFDVFIAKILSYGDAILATPFTGQMTRVATHNPQP